ncbi:hypothetical protein [African swine fever virus]|nr:hypothetical protein [African swine fever virus]
MFDLSYNIIKICKKKACKMLLRRVINISVNNIHLCMLCI